MANARIVKRVPMDFDYPLGKVWYGYDLMEFNTCTSSCENCKEFARLKGIGMETFDCPCYESYFQEVRESLKKLCEPPKGDGYQLWETTAGSPLSPVFKSLDLLCEWCEDNATTYGKYKATKDEWLRLLSPVHRYYISGIGYDSANCVTDYTVELGDFDSYEDAYEAFVALQCSSDEKLVSSVPSEVFSLHIQLEECEVDDISINCVAVKNEWCIERYDNCLKKIINDFKRYFEFEYKVTLKGADIRAIVDNFYYQYGHLLSDERAVDVEKLSEEFLVHSSEFIHELPCMSGVVLH